MAPKEPAGAYWPCSAFQGGRRNGSLKENSTETKVGFSKVDQQVKKLATKSHGLSSNPRIQVKVERENQLPQVL